MAGGSARTRAVAASMLAHAGVFGVLVWGLSRPPEPAPERIMQVELAPPSPRRAVEAREPQHQARAVSPALRPHVTPPSVDAPAAVAVPEAAGRADVRQVLRGLVGCERARFLGLSEAEQARCRERLAAGVERAPRLALKRAGEFDAARDPEPYLIRKPKDGCKVRAAGAAPVMGKDGAAAGLGCAWSF